MSRESEKALKAMHQFLEENGAENMSMDEVNELIQEFTADYNKAIAEYRKTFINTAIFIYISKCHSPESSNAL
mgnify:CR=1 FL=1